MSDVRERMQETARTIDAMLPPGTGFVLLAFDFGGRGRLEYCSNAQRTDIVRTMEEFISKSKTSFGEHQREELLAGTANYEIAEEDRQVIIRALALLAVVETGMTPACDRIAKIFHGDKEFENLKTFTISPDGKSITCLTCGKTSWNLNDVRKLYCGHCHKFHQFT